MAKSDIQAIVDAGLAKFMQCYEKGDMKGLSELYTEDCKLLAPGMDVQIGRKAVEETGKFMKSQGIAKMVTKSYESSGFGDMAYDCSKYSFFTEDGKEIDNGKILVVWKKVKGVYLIHADCFNSSQRGPGQPK